MTNNISLQLFCFCVSERLIDFEFKATEKWRAEHEHPGNSNPQLKLDS